MESSKKSSFDEAGWIIGIRENFEQAEIEDETDIPVTIFNVPKPLLVGSLNCYVPQQVAIGPYNYFSPEQLEMQRYKVAAAKRMQKRRPNLKVPEIFERFKKHNLRIRAHYQRFLELNQDTLAWMMAVDTCFLLELLEVCAAMAGKNDLATDFWKTSPLIHTSWTKTTHNAILRDVVMVENQIPLFALREVLEMQLSSLNIANEVLISMFVGFCKEISPFRGNSDSQNSTDLMMESTHLLDFLYHTIVHTFEAGVMGDNEEEIEYGQDEENNDGKKSPSTELGDLKKLMGIIWKGMSNFLFFKPLEVVYKLPWSSIYNFKDPIEDMLLSSRRNEESGSVENSPLVEEIGIPSVRDLCNAGVKFAPIYTSIHGINFDVRRRTMYLPMVSVDINSEVVLRNLVAYEACNASGPLVFTRYIELMNGIIDSVEDVKILRQNGIVMNHLKSDIEVTKLWNGMSRCIRLTKVDFLDKAIGDVNKYYEGRWKVKLKKMLTRYVFESWKILTLLAALLMLILMAIQTFCSVYDCPRGLNLV